MPEKDLFAAVINRAVFDAGYNGANREACNERRRAATWIRDAGEDFQLVCALAGVDPSYVRDRFIAGKARLRERKGPKHG